MTTRRKPKHAFLTEHSITEAHVVVCLSTYKNETNQFGGFKRVYNSHQIYDGPGHLWPDRERAVGAAKWAIDKRPNMVYGVFKLTDIIEASTPPIKVTQV